MNSRHQGRKRAGVIAAAGVVTLIGTGILASPASAHTPKWTVTCDKVTVDLSYYNSNVTNSVEITAGGKDILAPTTFDASYHTALDLPQHSSAIDVKLIIKAGDDTSGEKGYSKTETQTVQPCEGSTPPPSQTPSQSPSSSPTQSASPSPSTSASSSAPATVPSPSTSAPGTKLADTGSSSSTPIIAGVAAAVVVAGGALVLMSRKRRAGAS